MESTKQKEIMPNFIQCPHCQEEMNSADWAACGRHCPHCQEAIHPHVRQDRRLGPLISLRKRLNIQLMLNKENSYAF
jgi:Zn finger protein HypA/HybF involved in hydrogenase expression